MIGLLLTVTAADGAARGESVAVVIVAGALVLLAAWPQIRRERRERARRRQVQTEIDAARRRREARAAMDRARRKAGR